jgi:hypothetical protein
MRRGEHDSKLLREKHLEEQDCQRQNAAMGIRTPVASVRGSHDWPDYTIAAELLNKMCDEVTYSFLRVRSDQLRAPAI